MSSETAPLRPDQFEALLAQEAPAFGVSLSPGSASALARYLSELDLWRRRTNLTGNLSPQDLAAHSLESVLGESLIHREARETH